MPGGYDSSAGLGGAIIRAVNADTTRSSTTPAAQPDLAVPLGLGGYVFNYYPVFQSAATSTGHKMSLNFTGTAGRLVYTQEWLTAATTASDDVPDYAHTAAPGGVISGYAARASGTAGLGVTTDVDAANADVIYFLRGFITVTVAGTLDFYWAPEAAANATLMAGSPVLIWRTG